jgi:cytoskeletal protein RodZ
MTARHQLRIGKRLGRDRNTIDATPAPPVGETLQLARERKGVDLYRAERDTKIRLRYLEALEDSDWDELPAPVYTKGFLRNYAIYLGLEPDEILDRWREEMEQLRTATRVAVAPPPMPLVEPGGRRFTLSPAIIVALLVVVVIALFFGYLGVQFMRFVDVTPVALTYPANVVSTIDAEQVTLQGTAGRGALIAITGPDGTPYSTTADENGNWSRQVPLASGRNNFTVIATDPVTQRAATPLQLTVIVPLPSNSPGAISTVAPPPPITLNLFGPPNGYTTTDPSVTISGSTTGTNVTIASAYIGAPPVTPPPTIAPSPSGSPDPNATPTPTPKSTPSPTPSPSPSPSPLLSPGASPTAAPVGPSADLTVTNGQFSQALTYPVGHWSVTVTSQAAGLAPVVQQIEILVQAPPVQVHTMTIFVAQKNGVTLRVTADGVVVPGLDGIHAADQAQFTVEAQNQWCVHTTGTSISLTVDGTPLLELSQLGSGQNWIVKPTQQPQPTSQPC